MYGFSVIVSAETASFRDPGGQLYHATLPMPPVSTLIGVAGAALGMDFYSVWIFFKEKDLHVGVKDISFQPPGRALDLWKYRKAVSGEKIGEDIVKREFLYQPTYQLFYGAEIMEVVTDLHNAFLQPSWALTLGNSDDLTKVRQVTDVIKLNPAYENSVLSNCLICGDYSSAFSFDWEIIKAKPLNITLRLPVVKQLPVDFRFEKDGERKADKYKPFTFLTDFHELKNPGSSYYFGEKTVAQLISIAGD